MTGISIYTQEVLLKVYIGQNINRSGILQSQIKDEEQKQILLSESLIKENHWYLRQFLTTDKGSTLGKTLVEKRIEERENQLQTKLQDIPSKVLGFFVKRYVSKKLVFRTQKPYFMDLWEDRILTDGRIWILWDKFFTSLESVGLCIKTFDYVSTRGGELRDLCYVISSEIQEFLINRYSLSDFTPNQEETLKLHPVLMLANRILATDDIDYARQRYYELLKTHSVTEGQLAGIVNDMNKERITSEYRGLLSEKKTFEVTNPIGFQVYLDTNLIEPAVNILLERGGKIKEYVIEEKIPSLSEVKAERGFLDFDELGVFYITVSSLERELREFIKEKLGKGWIKRIENDIPNVVKRWKEKEKRDAKWGIDPELDLMNYADLEDYIEIISKFDRMFADNDRDIGNITTQLEIWYNHGRNPLMHSRTVTRQKYDTARSAIDFLKQWMRRRS